MEVHYQLIGDCGTAENVNKLSTILNLDNPYRNELIYDTSSNSPQSTNSQESADYNTNQYYMNKSPGSINVQDNMSPSSNISDYSSYNIQSLNINNSYEINYNEQPSTSTNYQQSHYTQQQYAKPHLVITEQPMDKFRFRYQSEMHGTHGSLMGRRTEKSKKVYPTVELRGYNGNAQIRCTLYQVDGANRSAHSHRLVIKNGDVDTNDPHEINVSPEKGYSAVFQGMGIIHTAKKFIAQELFKKRRAEKCLTNNRELTPREELKEKAAADNESKSMNLNQVCLCFQAFHVDDNNFVTQLCEPVYSESINNVKSAITGALKICRISSAVSSATGGDELFLFVEKVCKNNIKVRFYEIDEYDQEIWEDWGVFSEIDVHHQYAIALKTPPYKNPDIEHSVDVFVQLYRPRDMNRSEPIAFKYKPKMPSTSSGKRRRVTTSAYNSSDLSNTVGATNNTPTVLNASRSDYYDVTVSKEFNTPAMIQDMLEYPPQHTDISMQSNEYKHFVLNSEELKNIILDMSEGNDICKLETDSVPKNKEMPFIDHFYKIYYCNKNMEPEKAKPTIASLFRTSCEKGENYLHSAIENNVINVVQKTIAIFKQHSLTHFLNIQNEQRENSVHIACLYKRREILNYLVDADTDVYLMDINGNTPLHLCAEEDLTDCAHEILKRRDIKIDAVNNLGTTPLQLAIIHGQTAMVRLLIQHCASCEKIDLKSGDNILHLAVKQRSERLVEIILKTTVDELVNEPNNSGYTPLHLACAEDNREIVKLLMSHNADPLLTNKNVVKKLSNNGDSSGDSGDEIESDDTEHFQNCFHLATNKPEILELLNQGRIDSKSVADLKKPSVEPRLFDDECMEQLCGIFNNDSLWRILATLYDFSAYTDVWEQSKNPSQMLFNLLEVQGEEIENVITIFETLDQQEAIRSIDEMLIRRLPKAESRKISFQAS